MRWLIAATAALAAFTSPAKALGPLDICVLYNKNLPVSKSVAEYYCKKRGVPIANLIPLDVPDIEQISRADYESRILKPLRAALKERIRQPRVLLTVYGIPLRIGEQEMTAEEKTALEKAKPEVAEISAQVQKLSRSVRLLKADVEKDPAATLADALAEREGQLKAAEQKLADLQERMRQLAHVESTAAVDSELMLMWWPPYPLTRWMLNPLYWQVPEAKRRAGPPTLMTCRLDGPTAEVAKRLVDDAMQTEKRGGLAGKVYIDARGIKFDPKADPMGTGYGGYDESFREAAALLYGPGKMNVILDDQEELFPINSCPNCALYCGWYALQNYRRCCIFMQGAVAWHLASLEMTHLRNPGKEWAGNLLLDGAAATLGPVAEPYTIGFPRPEEFLGFLVTGQYTLVECYARTTFLTSWVMCLVGDPLYNPYAKTPLLKPDQVQPSPKGATRVIGN
jgi:uncharacterized protein (TIGR03790 family)